MLSSQTKLPIVKRVTKPASSETSVLPSAVRRNVHMHNETQTQKNALIKTANIDLRGAMNENVALTRAPSSTAFESSAALFDDKIVGCMLSRGPDSGNRIV